MPALCLPSQIPINCLGYLMFTYLFVYQPNEAGRVLQNLLKKWRTSKTFHLKSRYLQQHLFAFHGLYEAKVRDSSISGGLDQIIRLIARSRSDKSGLLVGQSLIQCDAIKTCNGK